MGHAHSEQRALDVHWKCTCIGRALEVQGRLDLDTVDHASADVLSERTGCSPFVPGTGLQPRVLCGRPT